MSAAPRYRLFGTFRLLLASMVLVSHGSTVMLPDSAPVIRLSIGNAGVFMFFVLSGFVISEALEGFYPRQPGRFLANRLLRILPGYWVALGVTILIWLAIGHPDLHRLDLPTVLGNVLLFGNDLRISSFNVISIGWSLIIEMEFYVVAAILYWLIARTGRRGIWLAAAAVAGLLGYIGVVETQSYYRFFGPLFYAPFFILGAGVYHWTNGNLPRLPTIALTIAAGGFAVHGFVLYILRGRPLEVAPSLAIVVALFVAMLVLARVSAPALNRVDWQLGDMTYLVYLLHIGIANLLGMLLLGRLETPMPTQLAGAAAIGMLLLTSFATAAVLQRLAIRPLTRLRNKLRGTELYR